MSEKKAGTKRSSCLLGEPLTRRQFLASSAFLGGSALILSQVEWAVNLLRRAEAGYLTPTQTYELAKAENILHSVCLNCHVRCPMKGKVLDGVLVKLDGSPFAAKTYLPNIPYDTPLAEAATIDGKLCSKGQAGIQLLYDPYRLRRVLKRDGPRGSNRWKTIPFGRAIEEIVGGGKLFAHVKGEKNRVVPGLKEVFALRDPQVAKKMAADIERLKERKMTVAEFQAKHRAHLGALIDPDQPDLGPKNNQFVFLAGRIQHGRKELGKRFTKGAFGSVNFYEHTTICEQSHHIATFEMTRDPLTGKGKTHFKPDFLNSEFVIFWGTGAFEANFGLTAMAELVTRPLAERNLKYAVIDPRLSKTAARAWRWVPIIPGADAALALAMTRWVIEKGRFDRRYLENANQAAAKRDGEPTSTDATHLVRADTLLFLRPEDVGLPKREGKGEFHVVMTPEGPRRHDRAEHGLLEVSTTAGGIPVKSVFTLLKERAFERSLDEYAEICGVSSELIEELSTELTGHGKRVAIDTYRGPVQHTNGYYAQQAILALNLLVGSMDWKGGLSGGGGHWHEMGDKPGQPFPLKKLHPGKLKSFGVTLSKERWHYEQSTLFERDRGYPAKRPWYPFTGNVYQEVIPAAGARYPYPIKALWLHKGTPVLSTPGGGAMIPILRDLEAIPLLLADDVVVGETSMYCDYIFPDLSYMERWGTPHDNPQPSTKNSLIRQPIASPIPETVRAFGQEMPCSMEAVMLALAEKLGLPGHGKDGFGPGLPFARPEEFFLKMVANVAAGDKPGDAVREADDAELSLFRKARRHLPRSVFDEAKWVRAAGAANWRRVVTVLNRGGRFEPFSKAYDGDYMAHKFGKPFHLYVERVAKAKNSITGERFDGLPRYEPPLNSDGAPVEDRDYPFHLITFKEASGGHSRTIPTYWSNIALLPENFVLMNKGDARRLGLRDGQVVKLISRTNGDGVWPLGDRKSRMVGGKVRAVEGIRPGVLAVSWHYGHWAYGAEDIVVDGRLVKGDPRRGKGLCANAVMLLDGYTRTACLTDPIGGSASFFDTRVRVVKGG